MMGGAFESEIVDNMQTVWLSVSFKKMTTLLSYWENMW